MILTHLYKKLFFFTIFFLMFVFVKSQRIKDSVKVEVDFSKKIGNVNSMSGFLHYDNVRLLEKNIKELKPKYWRIGWSYKSPDDIPYLRSFGITPILVISDLYGYPGKKNNKNWPHPLYTDNLKTLITSEYQKFKNTVIYDIWNEPFHQAGFGDFDKVEFYQIFKKGHDIIRSLPGGDKAMITGPSLDNYNEKEMDDFLNFCNSNNVRVDVLCWHEFRDQEGLKDFSKDMIKLRTKILPKYPKVGVKRIVLTEILNQYSMLSASEVLHNFKSFENNDIDGTCKSCWAESDGVFNCNNSMNGLLDKNGKTRAIYWAYEIYNQSLKNRVKDWTNYDQASVFASYDKNGGYIIVNNNSGNKVVNTVVKIKNLQSVFGTTKKLDLKIYEIPNTREEPLERMIFNKSQKINITKNITEITIPAINPKTIYYLLLSK
ncbi:GH39 family glycosyl hydrolase [Chryseobacterium terrae]|uniref:Glycosyl hydrolases family 39 N-terminal catalytic domain-containing protein n=1 Tax=Chryseobacterium terrae TaxID=3163299 RepID=A0ABW8Y689_9FLAO